MREGLSMYEFIVIRKEGEQGEQGVSDVVRQTGAKASFRKCECR